MDPVLHPQTKAPMMVLVMNQHDQEEERGPETEVSLPEGEHNGTLVSLCILGKAGGKTVSHK